MASVSLCSQFCWWRLIFFFSSRRRHTRLQGDWSSDVCSSDLLERYKNIAIDHYKDKAHNLFFVYLKTGNDSLSTLKQVTEKGYSIIGRKEFLNVLNKHSVGNDIYNDFKEHLSGIEIQTNSYTQFANVTTNWKAAEGFYLKLQDLITEWTGWQPVPTPSGHFLG